MPVLWHGHETPNPLEVFWREAAAVLSTANPLAGSTALGKEAKTYECQ